MVKLLNCSAGKKQFLTQKESTWQISSDSEQLGKSLQICHLGPACPEPFNCKCLLYEHQACSSRELTSFTFLHTHRLTVSPGQTVLPTQASSTKLRWSWVLFGHPLGLRCLELAWIWSSSNVCPTRAKFSSVWPPQPTQANSRQVVCYVTTRLYSDNWVVSCQQARLGGTVCPPHRRKFWFCNLARVGLSWEDRLARAFGDIWLQDVGDVGDLAL